jgi:hypothetical protein
VPQGGSLELNSQTPLQLGVTCWRTLVTYVPQTRVHPPGTPAEFYFSVQVLISSCWMIDSFGCLVHHCGKLKELIGVSEHGKRSCTQQFKAQRGRPRGDLPALIHRLGLEQSVLNQPWTQLSVRTPCTAVDLGLSELCMVCCKHLCCNCATKWWHAVAAILAWLPQGA